MSILTFKESPRAQNVSKSDEELIISLTDGRTISVPLSYYASLINASHQALNNFQILGDGEGIHWPDLDKDLSIKGILLGLK